LTVQKIKERNKVLQPLRHAKEKRYSSVGMNENTSSLQQLLAGLQGPPGGEGGGGVGLLKNNPGREDNVNTSASSSSSSSSSSNNNNNLMINNGQQPGDNANHRKLCVYP